MFTFIKGKLVRKSPSLVEIESGGIGYEIHTTLRSLSEMGEIGQETVLYTCVLFRDDTFHIYGFKSYEERDIFKELIKISGVGPKIALAILSYLDFEDFIDCVNRNNVDKLMNLPGVGRKTAERVLLEFREKAKKLHQREGIAVSGEQNTYYEVISALNVLGFQENKVKSVVNNVLRKIPPTEQSVENVLKNVLKALNK